MFICTCMCVCTRVLYQRLAMVEDGLRTSQRMLVRGLMLQFTRARLGRGGKKCIYIF